MDLILTGIRGIPEVMPGDDIGTLLIESIAQQAISPRSGDIFVVTQKIVSKAENRYVNLSTVIPSEEAIELSKISRKQPELIELILRESRKIIRINQRTIITEHRLGFVSANAGIDHSNVFSKEKDNEDLYLLLPKDPERSAGIIRNKLMDEYGVNIGVMIIDSHGRAWRYGTVGSLIGTAGVPALVDLRGKSDLHGYKLKITRVGAADELAGAASLIMGQADESIPAVHVRGFPYPLRNSSLNEVIRPENKDLFR